MSQNFVGNFLNHLVYFGTAHWFLIAGSNVLHFYMVLELRGVEGGHYDIFGLD